MIQAVTTVNNQRRYNYRKQIRNYKAELQGSSYIDSELKAKPELSLEYIIAPPRMALYMEYSTRIYNIYLKYIAPEDIHVYSIDEVFMDVTDYLQTYIDSVISAKFVTPKKAEILLEKLVGLSDRDMLLQYMKDIVVENRQKHRNCYSYYSIDVIQEALAKDRRIYFKYFDLDENKNKIFRHNGKIYEVCPITMINGMDNYYLIGYEPCSNSSREKSFRIDRMDDTTLSKRKIGNIPFDKNECIKRYRSSVFSMYSGQRIMAEFEFDFKAMNIIYDKYGEDTKITKLGENKYYAKLPVEDSPTFWGWIFMLEDRIRILSPSHLVKEYSEKLDRMRRIVKCV